jgi:hypothetical protein
MKSKRENNKQSKVTGTVNSGERKDDNLRNKEEQKQQESIRYERQATKRSAKRVYHPDGPGGSYDGL